MPLNGPDTVAWTANGAAVILPSYYAYVNGAFINVNAPGAPVQLDNLSRGVVTSKFVPKRGEINLGNTDPLPTQKQPSEFSVALGVGVYLGFTQAMQDAEAERQRVAESQVHSITQTDLLGCMAGLARAQAKASAVLVGIVEAKTLRGKAKSRNLVHAHSRK